MFVYFLLLFILQWHHGDGNDVRHNEIYRYSSNRKQEIQKNTINGKYSEVTQGLLIDSWVTKHLQSQLRVNKTHRTKNQSTVLNTQIQ